MYPGTTLKNTIQQTILRNKKTVPQLADEVGRSDNSLYRYGIEGESGSEMPVSLLVPIMKATNNYSILKYIAALCGYILVKIPKMKASKKEELEMLSDYQAATTNSLKCYSDFLKHADQNTYEALNKSLLEVMEHCSAGAKYAEKKLGGQLEMDYAE
ncbi:MAG: phage regulatory CII family protein [Bacteroidota bacterium]